MFDRKAKTNMKKQTRPLGAYAEALEREVKALLAEGQRLGQSRPKGPQEE